MTGFDGTPHAPDPMPARILREELAGLRREGIKFAAAWPLAQGRALAAVKDPERGQWRLAFKATRKWWRRAYLRLGRCPAPLPVEHEPSQRSKILLLG
jgi:hypothetical protein